MGVDGVVGHEMRGRGRICRVLGRYGGKVGIVVLRFYNRLVAIFHNSSHMLSERVLLFSGVAGSVKGAYGRG